MSHNIDYTQALAELNKGLPDQICYENHPAYAPLIASATVTQKIKSLVIFFKYTCLVLIKRFIHYEQTPAHVRKPKTMIDVGRLVTRPIKYVLQKAILKNDAVTHEKSQEIVDTLHEQGVCIQPIDSVNFKEIIELSAPVFEALRRQRNLRTKGVRDFSESRTTLLATANQALFKSVASILSELGIMDAVSSYIGRPAAVIDINPQINDSSDSFWTRIFPDLTLEKPSTTYFHRDASGGDVKAIIYLSDVGPDNGPFSFVLGSHKNRPGRIRNFIQEVNDYCGFSSTDLSARRHFSALPMFLRRKCAFGNDLLPESIFMPPMLAAEWKITAARGHVVLFDSKGIHRGGMVLENERVVLTCVLG